MKAINGYLAIPLAVLILGLMGCSTTTVDEHREVVTALELDGDDNVVVLGRRHAGHYDTEPGFIDCIARRLGSARHLNVVPERLFINNLYPWFEPRTAPLTLTRLEAMIADPLIAGRFREAGIRYMIWVDGNTETEDSRGSISCAVAPGAAGCFGFGSWDRASHYEAVIWDIDELAEKGQVMVDTEGSSYMVAIGVPIPFIARVQGEACSGIGNQLRAFFEDVPVYAGD